MTISAQKIDGKLVLDAIAFARPDASPKGELGGVAMRFGVANRNGFAVEPGALTVRASTPMLWTHDAAAVIGRWDSVRTEGDTLVASGQLNLAVAKARETLALVKGGDVTGLSVGLWVKPSDAERRGDVLVVRRALLEEISVVAIPAEEQARIRAVAQIQTATEFEKFLREAGFPRAAAKRLTAGGWHRLRPPDDEQIEALAQRVQLAASELHRR